MTEIDFDEIKRMLKRYINSEEKAPLFQKWHFEEKGGVEKMRMFFKVPNSEVEVIMGSFRVLDSDQLNPSIHTYIHTDSVAV